MDSAPPPGVVAPACVHRGRAPPGCLWTCRAGGRGAFHRGVEVTSLSSALAGAVLGAWVARAPSHTATVHTAQHGPGQGVGPGLRAYGGGRASVTPGGSPRVPPRGSPRLTGSGSHGGRTRVLFPLPLPELGLLEAGVPPLSLKPRFRGWRAPRSLGPATREPPRPQRARGLGAQGCPGAWGAVPAERALSPAGVPDLREAAPRGGARPAAGPGRRLRHPGGQHLLRAPPPPGLPAARPAGRGQRACKCAPPAPGACRVSREARAWSPRVRDRRAPWSRQTVPGLSWLPAGALPEVGL